MEFYYALRLVFVFLFVRGIIAIDYEDSDFPESSELTQYNSTNIIYDDDYDDTEECSVDTLIDILVNNLLPDDYEEGKQLDFKRKINHLNESIAIARRFHKYSQNVREKMEPIIKRVMPRMSEILFLIDLPSDCMASLARIGSSAQDGHQWAQKFLDSMPSISSGQSLLSGPPIGQYDECLSIISPYEADKPTIKGQYCSLGISKLLPSKDSYSIGEPIDDYLETVINGYMNESKSKSKIKPEHKKYFSSDGTFVLRPKWLEDILDGQDLINNLNVKFPTGFCLPTTCDPKDLESAINKLMFPITRIPFSINPDCDYTDKPVVLNNYQKIAIITFLVLAVLVVLSTLFEFILNENNKSSKTSYSIVIGKSFSIITNLKPIFNVELENKKFAALDGIRAIFGFWIFIEHEYLSGLLFVHVKKMMDSAPFYFSHEFKYLLLKNFNIIETFFLIGGMMTCYVMFSRLDKSKGRFSYFQYAIYRYLRTIPTVIGAMFIIYLSPLIGDGPLWSFMMHLQTAPCIKNWNSSLMMINNYNVDTPDRFNCNGVTWYTACDYQLYLMAPLVFLVLYHWPRIGLIFNTFLIVLGSFIMITPKVLLGLPSLFETKKNFSTDRMLDVIVHHYWGVEPHFGVYMLGILLGYLIRQKPNLYFGGRIGELFLWIISWAMTVWSFFWVRNYWAFDYYLTETEALLWLAFSKYFYSAGWFWTIYACSTGRGGFVNDFFGWKGFKVISNLVFEIFLTHTIVIAYRIAIVRDQVFYSDHYIWTSSIFDFILTFILSVALYLLVSGPFANLLNILLKPPVKDSDFKANNDKNITNNSIISTEDNVCVNNETNYVKASDTNFVDINNENNIINIKISDKS